MYSERKQRVYDLLKSIETGDPEGIRVVDETQYIQHNPQTAEGGVGLAKLFARLAKSNPRVDILRLFEDGDYIFGHVRYDFSRVRVGFEVFRFAGEYIVEHWDNIQSAQDGMTAGTTNITDHAHTEENRHRIHTLCTALTTSDTSAMTAQLTQLRSHSPHGDFAYKMAHATYTTTHHILAEGNFVLTAHAGMLGNTPTSFYDLFRLEQGSVVEHWDTTETIPPREEWKNDNGKF